MTKLSTKNIPNYLEASSKSRLRSLMLKTSVRRGGHVKFYDFYEQKDGKHVCWFIDEIDEHEIVKEQLGMNEVQE